MKTIRTFLAIPLPSALAHDAINLVTRLRSSDSDSGELDWDSLKWVPLDNLHLTLKFLGEVDNVETPQVCRVLADVCGDYDPFELRFQGTATLPSESKARVLAIRIEDPSGSLCGIVSKLEDRFADLGFKREPRDYRPHLTLARAKGNQRKLPPDIIKSWLTKQEEVVGEMVADHVQVIGSFLEKRGPTYNVMHTVDL